MNSEDLKLILEHRLIEKINHKVLSHIRFNHSKMYRYHIKGFSSLFNPANSSMRMIKNKVKSYEF